MTMLSDYFSLEELIHSQYAARHGIDNVPPPDVLANLGRTAHRMDDVRKRLGALPIIVSSGYRSTRVNSAIGGVTFPPSAHTLGYAVDFTCPTFGPPLEICQRLAAQADLAFDQLIFEYGAWVHISFDPRNRRELLTIRSSAEGYVRGIVDLPPIERAPVSAAIARRSAA